MKKNTILIFSLLITAIFLITLVMIFQSRIPAQPLLELKVSAFDGQFNALIFYAEHLNLFEKEQLKIEYILSDSGVNTVENLLAGDADLATAAEFVAVNFIQENPQLRILNVLSTGNVNSIIYKNDINLHSSDQKRIGVKLKSQAEFFLQRYFVYNDLSMETVDLIDTNPTDMLDKLSNNELDAVVVWNPFAWEIENVLEDKVKFESVQAGQELYFLLFSKADITETKGVELQRFLKALVKADDYRKKNEDDFQAFIKERFDYSQKELENTLEKCSFSISLSQGLINAMEAEAKWNIMSGVFSEQTLPNYLNVIDTSFLLTVAPDRMLLYH